MSALSFSPVSVNTHNLCDVLRSFTLKLCLCESG